MKTNCSIYGIRAVYTAIGADGCDVSGTNRLTRWLLTWWPDLCLWTRNRLAWLVGADQLYDWPIWMDEDEKRSL